tara:strand:+ start:1012 stop:1128 length:117 start_codon:yes stop_codon:yes gene_type:complete
LHFINVVANAGLAFKKHVSGIGKAASFNNGLKNNPLIQ